MMTPKEKAEELFDKMSTNNGDEHHHCTHYVAKQCALIAVDEVLNSNPTKINCDSSELNYGYYQKVKKEIELL